MCRDGGPSAQRSPITCVQLGVSDPFMRFRKVPKTIRPCFWQVFDDDLMAIASLDRSSKVRWPPASCATRFSRSPYPPWQLDPWPHALGRRSHAGRTSKAVGSRAGSEAQGCWAFFVPSSSLARPLKREVRAVHKAHVWMCLA